MQSFVCFRVYLTRTQRTEMRANSSARRRLLARLPRLALAKSKGVEGCATDHIHTSAAREYTTAGRRSDVADLALSRRVWPQARLSRLRVSLRTHCVTA